MKQEQSIGSNNQQQGMPDRNKKAQTSPAGPENLNPGTPQPEKPEVTNDAGNRVDKEKQDSGKGYNEKKPTESWSRVDLPGEMPAAQATSEQEKVGEKGQPGASTAEDPGKMNKHQDYPHQTSPEGKEEHEKRIRQSENVAG